MIVLDASVVIAMLAPHDSHHADAVAFMRAHASEGFAIHSLTLAEVLVGAVKAGRAHQLVADLTEMGVGQFEAADGEAIVLAELRATTGLKMPDCCVLSAALSLRVPLATFDEALAAVARGRGVEVWPER